MSGNVLEMNMEELREEIKREIESYFNEKLYDSPVFKLSERIVRVEDEIKHLGERIEDLIHQMDKRFEQVDKRFEDLIHQIDKRFEHLEKKLIFISWFIPVILTAVIILVPLVLRL